MYTAALKRSEGESEAIRVPVAVRFLDLLALAAAFPVFLLADLPLAGYGAAAGAWVAQRTIRHLLQRRAGDSDDPRTIAGLAVASMIARGWLVAFAIFGVGLASGDEAGLAAAVLVLALFTLYLTLQFILRPLESSRRGLR